MQEERYTINGTYLAIVQTPKDLSYYPIIRINVGGPTKLCINICVYATTNIAYLSAVGYNKRCTLDESLEKGEGTKDMIRSALAFAFQKYPKLRGINLKDMSQIKCANQKYLSLPHHSIALTGKTWYDKHFGAKPEEKAQHDLYKSMKAYTRTALPDLQTFKNTYLITTNVIDEVYTRCHKEHLTYRKFFNALAREHPDCAIFTHDKWLTKFMDAIPHCEWLEAMWLIKRRRVESWPRAIIQKIGNHKTSLRLGGGCDSRGSSGGIGSVEHAKSFRRLRLTQGDLY